MKLESFTPATPALDDVLGEPMRCFEVGSRGVKSIELLDSGAVLVTIERDRTIQIGFGSSGYWRLPIAKGNKGGSGI